MLQYVECVSQGLGCHSARCMTECCWWWKGNSSAFYASAGQINFADSVFLLQVLLMNFKKSSQSLFMYKWIFFGSVPRSYILQTKALLPLIDGMEWLQSCSRFVLCVVSCVLLSSLLPWRCLIMSLWHRAAVSLADRQAFTPVTAASCHLGPCTDGGGQGHASGRTWDKVICTLAYWLAHSLSDWLTWFSVSGLDRTGSVRSECFE